MGIAPIGPIAMLPSARLAGTELKALPIARVEVSARTGDETYSQGGRGDEQQPGKEAQESESGSLEDGFFVHANEESLENEASFKDEASSDGEASFKDETNFKGETGEIEDGLTETAADAALPSESPDDPSSKISLFA